MSFIAELKRRKVLRVAAVYAAEPIRSHPRFREQLRKLGLETGRRELP